MADAAKGYISAARVQATICLHRGGPASAAPVPRSRPCPGRYTGPARSRRHSYTTTRCEPTRLSSSMATARGLAQASVKGLLSSRDADFAAACDTIAESYEAPGFLAALEKAGAFDVIVAAAASGRSSNKRLAYALLSLRNLAMMGDAVAALLKAGPVPALFRHLNHAEPSCHENACVALCAAHKSQPAAVARELAALPGAAAALVQTLLNQQHGARWAAAHLVSALAEHGLVDQLLAAGAVPALVALLAAPGEDPEMREEVQCTAMIALNRLTPSRRGAQQEMLDAGGYAALVAVLRQPASRQHEAFAAELVSALAQPFPGRGEAALASGVLPLLCAIARRRVARRDAQGMAAQEGAVRALAHVCAAAECPAKHDVVASGVLPLLVAMLHSSDSDGRRSAAAHLVAGLGGCSHSRDAVLDAGAIEGLVQVGGAAAAGCAACTASVRARLGARPGAPDSGARPPACAAGDRGLRPAEGAARRAGWAAQRARDGARASPGGRGAAAPGTRQGRRAGPGHRAGDGRACAGAAGGRAQRAAPGAAAAAAAAAGGAEGAEGRAATAAGGRRPRSRASWHWRCWRRTRGGCWEQQQGQRPRSWRHRRAQGLRCLRGGGSRWGEAAGLLRLQVCALLRAGLPEGGLEAAQGRLSGCAGQGVKGT